MAFYFPWFGAHEPLLQQEEEEEEEDVEQQQQLEMRSLVAPPAPLEDYRLCVTSNGCRSEDDGCYDLEIHLIGSISIEMVLQTFYIDQRDWLDQYLEIVRKDEAEVEGRNSNSSNSSSSSSEKSISKNNSSSSSSSSNSNMKVPVAMPELKSNAALDSTSAEKGDGGEKKKEARMTEIKTRRPQEETSRSNNVVAPPHATGVADNFVAVSDGASKKEEKEEDVTQDVVHNNDDGNIEVTGLMASSGVASPSSSIAHVSVRRFQTRYNPEATEWHSVFTPLDEEVEVEELAVTSSNVPSILRNCARIPLFRGIVRDGKKLRLLYSMNNDSLASTQLPQKGGFVRCCGLLFFKVFLLLGLIVWLVSRGAFSSQEGVDGWVVVACWFVVILGGLILTQCCLFTGALLWVMCLRQPPNVRCIRCCGFLFFNVFFFLIVGLIFWVQPSAGEFLQAKK